MELIKIKITKKDIDYAKQQTEDFDKTKLFNKYECDNNYFGFLGEYLFDKTFSKKIAPKFKYEWLGFFRDNWNDPDFIISGKSFDLKTTVGTHLEVQTPKFDYYIFSRINPNEPKDLLLISFISGNKIQRLIKEDSLNKVKRGSNEFNCIYLNQMTPIERFLERLGVDLHGL